MRDSKWDDATRHPLRYEGDRIYREVLPQVLAELDSARPYIPSSPFGDGQANDGGTGDQHYWDVWHGRGDYPNYRDSTARFCSEFGFAAAPGHATWRAIDPTRNLLNADVRDPIARWHDKTAKGYETFLGFVELHYPSSRTVEEWIYRSQLNQRDALRFGIEHFRRSKFCRGTLIWQLNDCWPVQSWSVIDSSLQYKAAAFELRRLYAPLLTSLERAGQTVRLWGILDNVESSVNVDAVLALRRLSDGAVISSKTSSARLEPGDRRVLLELEVENASSNDCVVWARVGEQESTLLLAEPKELSLTASPLIVEVSAEYLTVVSSSPLIDLCLWDESGTVTFLDNFLTQLQPGRMVVRYRGNLTQIRARSLGGLHDVTVSVGEP
jgi:beta-mannosidase